jgi:hypothetical protein
MIPLFDEWISRHLCGRSTTHAERYELWNVYAETFFKHWRRPPTYFEKDYVDRVINKHRRSTK